MFNVTFLFFGQEGSFFTVCHHRVTNYNLAFCAYYPMVFIICHCNIISHLFIFAVRNVSCECHQQKASSNVHVCAQNIYRSCEYLKSSYNKALFSYIFNKKVLPTIS